MNWDKTTSMSRQVLQAEPERLCNELWVWNVICIPCEQIKRLGLKSEVMGFSFNSIFITGQP